MGKLVVTEFVSMDGVFEDPGGAEGYEHGGWTFEYDRGDEGNKFNKGPKYVVSSTLEDPEWQNTTVISRDVVGEIAQLKEQSAGTILVAGSGTLVATLLEAGLVDELRLMVFPTVLGRGKRLFPDGIDRLKFKLTDARQVGSDGVQVQVYERAGS
jgi:dihydrofolate reductase